MNWISIKRFEVAMRRFFVMGVLASVVFLLDAPASAAVEIREVKSQEGVTAWLVEDYTIPIVTMRFSFTGGTSQDPDGKAGLASLMSGLFDEGAGDLDADAFQARLEELGAEMSFRATSDAVSGQVRMLAERSREVFDLIRLAVNAPRFDPEPVDRIRGQIAVNIRSDERDPNKQGYRALEAALYGDHPYARPANGTLESLGSITADDLRAFHARVFARSNLTIGVVGAIDAATLGTALDNIFGSLPAQADLTPVDDVEPRLGEEVRIDYPLPQSMLQLVYRGIDRKDPDYYAAYLMNTILGGGTFSSRLYKEVREKRGLAYGVGSYLGNNDHSQMLGIQTATRSTQAGTALRVIEEVVAAMRRDGPSEAELAAAKTYVIGSYPINMLNSSGSIASALVQVQEEDLGIDYFTRRRELIEAVTLGEAKAAARRLLSDKPTTLIVGPTENEG